MTSRPARPEDEASAPDPGAGVEDAEAIRARFPALERRVNGRRVAYFDGPGGTQVPAAVAEAVSGYLLGHNANTGWAFPTSRETDQVLSAARSAVADLLGGSPREIVFGANMTTLTLHLSRALGRELAPGEEIVVTELDHHANVDSWRELARDRELVVRTACMRPETGELDWDDLEEKVSSRTALLALGGASNALGTVNDVSRARRLARSAGARLFVDAVHLVPHELVDVDEMGADFVVCSPYKFYGPHTGVLWARAPALERLDAPRLLPAPDRAPGRLETGTLNHEGIAGVEACVDFLASLGGGSTRRERLASAYRGLRARGDALLRRMWIGLDGLPGVELHGPPPHRPRTPTLAFTVHDRSAREVAERLSRSGLFLSHGDFYAPTVVDRLGLTDQGLVRAGCACYTTVQEVERLIAAVQTVTS